MNSQHRQEIYLCAECDFEHSSRENVRLHIKNQHDKAFVNCKCEDFAIIENNYKILKESYERLVVINKQLQTRTDDKEYALEVQNEELRNGYERMKKDNIKLQDSLDTQHKLWKVWLQKNDESHKEVVVKESSASDDEILLIEDNDTADDDNEKIFQKFMENAKQSGFKRTTPSEQAEKVVKADFKCGKCNFIAKSEARLQEHLKNAHAVTEVNSKNKSQKQYCHYWNNQENCNFESKNGRPCKFLHEKAPQCKFDGRCNRKRCMFSHQSRPFLDYNHSRMLPQVMPPFMNQMMPPQFQWGLPIGPMGHHLSEGVRWGNRRQF